MSRTGPLVVVAAVLAVLAARRARVGLPTLPRCRGALPKGVRTYRSTVVDLRGTTAANPTGPVRPETPAEVAADWAAQHPTT